MSNPFHSQSSSSGGTPSGSGYPREISFGLLSSGDASSRGAFQAFRKRVVVDDVPSPVTALACFGEHVYVGMKDGNLSMYKLFRPGADQRQSHERYRSNVFNDAVNRPTSSTELLVISRRIQSRKAVEKLEVVPQFQRLLVLCGARVTVHDLRSLETQSVSSDNIAKQVKSAVTFCVDEKSHPLSRLCVAQKNKLHLFEFTQGQYLAWKEISRPGSTVMVQWRGANLFVGSKSSYEFINVDTGKVTEVMVPREKGIPPFIHVLPQEHVLLGSTEIGVLVDENALPVAGVVDLTGRVALSGANTLAYFLVLSKPTGGGKVFSVDVQYTGLDQPCVQRILFEEKGEPVLYGETESHTRIASPSTSRTSSTRNSWISPGATLFGPRNGRSGSEGTNSFDSQMILLGTSSPSRIYGLEPVSYIEQVSHLLATGSIEHAEQLLRTTAHLVPGADKDALLDDFHCNACCTLFLNFDFQNVLRHVEQCTLNPMEVLHLFPDLHPVSIPPSTYVPRYFTLNKVISASDGNDAEDMESLASSKFERRKSLELAGRTEDTNCEEAISNARACLLRILETTRSRCTDLEEQRLVDSALLILYASGEDDNALRTFARGQNYVRPGDVSELLQRQQQFGVLALLHVAEDPRAALEIWMRMGTGEYEDASKENGVEATVECLASTEDTELVWTFASWIMRMDPERGTDVFCRRHTEENLAILPNRVMDFFKSFESDGGASALDWPATSRRTYLEFVVYDQGSQDGSLSTDLAMLYINAVLALRECGGSALRRNNAGTEPGELGQVRSKSLKFLRENRYYDVKEILDTITATELYEERIILLNRMGKHREALRIFVYKTNDVGAAVTYCQTYSPPRSEDPTRTRSLFLLLVSLLLNPAREDAASVTRKERYRKMGMDLLMKHADEMEPISVLKQLPPAISIASVRPFLEKVSQYVMHREQQDRILCNMAKVENLQARCELARLESRGIVIDDLTCCDVCEKPVVVKTVFVVFPNGRFAHFSCCPQGLDVDPITGDRFENTAEAKIMTDYFDGFITPDMKLKQAEPTPTGV